MIIEDPHAETSIARLTPRIGNILPPGDPLSPWLLRLAILRDDLCFEILGTADRDDEREDTVQWVWRNIYFIRRLSSTLYEIRQVFANQEFAQRLKPHRQELGDEVFKRLREARNAVEAAYEPMKALRDTVGVHIRPERRLVKSPRGRPKTTEDRAKVGRMLSEQRELKAEIAFSNRPAQAHFKGISRLALVIPWPDADLSRKLAELSDHTKKCWKVFEFIDFFFATLWATRGAIPIPPTADAPVR